MRSLCEILLSCGSNGRPIPCECIGLGDIYKSNLEPKESVVPSQESVVPSHKECCIQSLKQTDPFMDPATIKETCPSDKNVD